MGTRTAVLLVLGLILAALVHGGVYQIVVGSAGSSGGYVVPVAYRLNKFTGRVDSCFQYVPDTRGRCW